MSQLQQVKSLILLVMSKASLVEFIYEQIEDAKAQGILFSVHLKATMMKVSDPIIFGHFVKAFYADVFDSVSRVGNRVGFNPTMVLQT